MSSSSLHWLILCFLYAFFVRWSIFPTRLNSYPIPPPLAFWSAQTIPLYTHTQCSFVSHTHIYKPCSPLSFAAKKPDIFNTVNNFCSLEAFLMWLTMWKERLKMYLPKMLFAQRKRVKLLSAQRHATVILYFTFWLTMMSQIESIRSNQYTPLYENEKFERDLSQWRLQFSTISF